MVLQLMLFPSPPKAEALRLAVAAETAEQRRLASIAACRAAQRAAAAVLTFVQLALWGDPKTIICGAKPKPAKASPKPRPALASIFAMADAAAAARKLRAGGRFGAASGFRASPPPAKRPTIQREEGVVRCTGAAYPSNRWDAERIEQERARRAKQRPPKPTRAAKTRGKKVRAWDGEAVE